MGLPDAFLILKRLVDKDFQLLLFLFSKLCITSVEPAAFLLFNLYFPYQLHFLLYWPHSPYL